MRCSGKALRCCINFAAQQEGESFAIDLASALPADSAEQQLAVAPQQQGWLNATSERLSVSIEMLVHNVLALAMAKEPADDVFAVIRCKTKTNA